MTSEEFNCIQQHFHTYVNGFASADGDLHPLLQLKTDHCERVAAEARALSVELGWPLSDQVAAEALGFLHDVGRFSQFAEFGTFSDSASIDHGLRGGEVVRREGWLDSGAAEEKEGMLDAIRHHNGRTIPAALPPQSLAMLHLIRDADKLDILEIVLGEVARDGFQDLPKMLPHLSLDRVHTPEFIRELQVGKNASIQGVRSLADFLLLQLSWAYTLHSVPAVRRFHERGICGRILKQMDVDADVAAFQEGIERHIQMRLDESRNTVG